MPSRRTGFSWGALALGLALGLGGGLAYAWFINPVSYTSISPRQLKSAGQQEYILLVGHAYLQDFNLPRARQRLDQLGKGEAIGGIVAGLADDAFQQGGRPDDIRALAVLAEALGQHPRAAEVFSGTVQPTGIPPASPTPTLENPPSVTPSPDTPTPSEESTDTPTPVQIPANATLKLVVLKPICSDNYAAGRLEVYVLDASGGGIPAVKVQVQWDGGSDTFFTGLKPEISPGYADFQMDKNKTYTVTLPGLSEPVKGVSSADCQTESGKVSTPTIQLVFQPVGQ